MLLLSLDRLCITDDTVRMKCFDSVIINDFIVRLLHGWMEREGLKNIFLKEVSIKEAFSLFLFFFPILLIC